jgi:hypothetical protein
MSFIVESSGGNFERCPSGSHLARCYRIVDLGTQKSEYKGQVKFQHKITIGWEVHCFDDNGKPHNMRDGRPFAIFKNYTLSWAEQANLRIDLQAWRGKPFSPEEMQRFDLKNVLGKWCMINAIDRQGSNGQTYTNVGGVSPVPSVLSQRGLPTGINKLELFNLTDPDMALFETFSDKLKEKITSSPEWQKLHGSSTPKVESYADLEEIPF